MSWAMKERQKPHHADKHFNDKAMFNLKKKRKLSTAIE